MPPPMITTCSRSVMLMWRTLQRAAAAFVPLVGVEQSRGTSARMPTLHAEACATSLQLEFTDDVHASLHMIHRSLRQDPMAQIENVSRARAGALQQLMHAHPQFRNRSHQNGRIQVAL